MRTPQNLLFLVFLTIWNKSPRPSSAKVTSYCGPVGVVNQIDNKSSLVLLGGLFPLHKFEGQGRDNCGKTITKKGFQRSLGMVFAIEQINNNASFLPGIKLAYDIRDSCTSSVTSLEESLTFLPEFSQQDGKCLGSAHTVSSVVGPSDTGNCIPTQNLLRLFQIPQIAYAATGVELSDKSRYDYFFRVIPPDTFQAKAMADIVAYFNWTYVAAVYSDDVYGSNGIQEFIREFRSRNDSNNCIAQRFAIKENPSDKEIRRVVNAFRQPWVSNSSVIVFFGQNEHADAILEEWKRNSTGLKHMVWIASDSAATSIQASLYDQAHGMIGVEPSFTPNTAYDEWFKSLSLSNTAGSPWFEEYWKSIFHCNSTTCPEGLTFGNDSSYSQNSKVNFSMEAVYAVANALHDMHQTLCNGTPGLCAGMLQDSGRRINGGLLHKYLRNATLNYPRGAKEPLFDANQDRVGGYTIYNLQKFGDSFRYEEIGTWKENSLELNLSKGLEWGPQTNSVPQSLCSLPCQLGQYRSTVPGQPCCWQCIDCGAGQVSDAITCVVCPETHKPSDEKSVCQEIEKSYLKWDHPWATVILILSMIGVCGTVLAGVFYIAFHKKQAIIAGNRVMSAVIMGGILISFCLPILYLGRPTATTCALRRVGISVCFSICFGALLVKISRIYRVVNRVSLGQSLQKPRFINAKSQLFMVALIVFIPLVIVAIWLTLEQPTVKTNILVRWESVEIRCGADPRIGLSVILVYNLLLLIGCVYFTIRTRKVPKEYNEARFIHFAVITSGIVWIAFIAFYYSTTGLPELYIITAQVTAILITAAVLLLFLILHKIYSVLKNEKDIESLINTPSSALRRASTARKTIDLRNAKSSQSMESSDDLHLVKRKHNDLKRNYAEQTPVSIMSFEDEPHEIALQETTPSNVTRRSRCIDTIREDILQLKTSSESNDKLIDHNAQSEQDLTVIQAIDAKDKEGVKEIPQSTCYQSPNHVKEVDSQ